MHAAVKQIAEEMPQMLSDRSDTVPGNVLVLVCPSNPPPSQVMAFVGSSVERKFYMDAILPMGRVNSYDIFESFSSALE